MRFVDFVEELQKLNKNKVVFVKSGVFFNSIGRDAIILEKVLGLKRTCLGKGICKSGLPVNYVRENLDKIKDKFKENNIGFIIYDETENGNFIFNNRKYGVLLEMDGDVIEERKNTNCLECKNNIFEKRRFYQEFIKNKELNNENLNNQEMDNKKLNKKNNNKECTFKKEDYILILEILKNVFNSFKEKLDKENNINENTNDKTIK